MVEIKQLLVQEQCDTMKITYQPENTPLMDSYFKNTFKNLENHLNKEGNKKTATIKKEYKEIKEKLTTFYKDGLVSDKVMSELKRKILHLDGVLN